MRQLIFITLVIFSQSAWSDTTWVNGGNISGTWTRDGSPYIVAGLITIPAQQQLTIAQGVECLFRTTAGLSVRGRLVVDGAPHDSVSFKPVNDFGSWQGITFMDNADPSFIDHAWITRVAYSAASNAIRVRRSLVTVTHSSIRENLGRGIFLTPFGHIEMSDCEIVHNGEHG